MKRLLPFCLLAFALAGCEPYRPPQNVKLIQERTASGPVTTKLEARPQPYPPGAGQVSIWDLKVFDVKDKESGMRQEWKNFAQLPQQPNASVSNTQVLMNAWIISRDGTIFLPHKPTYKAYGSFVADWTIPRAGAYQLWVQYQPTLADESLKASEISSLEASKKLPLETARWDFKATGEKLEGTPEVADTSGVQASTFSGLPLAVYDAKGARIDNIVMLKHINARVRQNATVSWIVGGKPIENPEIVAIGPDDKTLLHALGKTPALTFNQAGKWRIWLQFERDGQFFAAPYVLTVKP